MVRNKYSLSNAGKSPSKKSRNNNKQFDTNDNGESEASSAATLISNGPGGTQRCDTVHKQNLHIISFPVIFVFNIVRSLLYQLFIVFRYIYNFTTKVLYKPVKKDCSLEVVVNDQNQHQHQTQFSFTNQHQLHDQQHCDSQHQPLQYPNSNILVNSVGSEMSLQRSNSGSQVGPGDPLLAKQKHHHRRAFEYISKALKIDEENEGKYLVLINSYR